MHYDTLVRFTMTCIYFKMPLCIFFTVHYNVAYILRRLSIIIFSANSNESPDESSSKRPGLYFLTYTIFSISLLYRCDICSLFCSITIKFCGKSTYVFSLSLSLSLSLRNPRCDVNPPESCVYRMQKLRTRGRRPAARSSLSNLYR